MKIMEFAPSRSLLSEDLYACTYVERERGRKRAWKEDKGAEIGQGGKGGREGGERRIERREVDRNSEVRALAIGGA